MHSCLYEGWVWHRRQEPRPHQFRYRMAFLYLDLDELEDAFRGQWLWSLDRTNVASFHRQDYLGQGHTPLPEAVHAVLAAAGLPALRGPIRLLTQPRYCGYLINPVSFYFCFDASTGSLAAVIAEVTNTPWRERRAYVLSPQPGAHSSPATPPRLPKQLYVSPFLPMEMEYGWCVSAPGEQLQLQIENFAAGRQVFHAQLSLTRRPWTAGNLRRLLWRYPFLTQRVALGIHWQALRLWWKGVPAFPHVASPLSPQPARTS